MSGWAGWCFIHESEMFRVGVGTGTQAQQGGLISFNRPLLATSP